MDKILEYMESKVSLIETEVFKGLNSEETFLKNYSMHDTATSPILLKYLQKNYSVHPIGTDLREKRGYIQNSVPDYYLEKIINPKESENFCFDIKSKSKVEYFGWANEYQISSYKKFSLFCNLPVFLIFSLVENGNFTNILGFCDIFKKPKNSAISKEGYVIYFYDWELGLPFIHF